MVSFPGVLSKTDQKRFFDTGFAFVTARSRSAMAREIDTNPWWGRTNKMCDFDASPHAVALISAVHE
jgi:hypothetical protein